MFETIAHTQPLVKHPDKHGLDQHVEDLALGIHGAPQIDHPAIDFQIDFVQMPYVDGPLLASRFG
jgi:hypothetical protein